MLAARADAQHDRRLEDDDPRDEDEGDPQPDHDVELPEDVADEAVAEERQVDVRNRREVARRSVGSVELEEEIAGDPECQEVDRRAADDLVAAQGDREDGVQETHQCTGADRDQDREHPRARDVRPPHGEERADEHHPLEPDVHDAGAFREQAAERRERERRGVAQHCRKQRAPDDDGVELGRARARGEVADQQARDSRRDRVPADPPLAADQPEREAERDREEADRDRQGRVARSDRGQRYQRRAHADGYGPEAESARSPRYAPRHAGTLFVRRPRRSQPSRTRIRTSAPTNSTTRPWMITARLPPTPGAKIVGSRFRDAVPVCSAAKRSAESPTPTAVFRPSSATAMPMKPMFAPWIVVMSTRYCQPRTS